MMKFEEIKAKFGDLIEKDSGDHFQCKCPGHKDNHASLSVSRGDRGQTLIKCHAGCNLARILTPMGLTAKDLFENDKPKDTNKKADPVIARYDYQDATGKIVFRVERKQSKKFVQCRPDPNKTGKWIYDLNNVNRVLYHLPDLLAASSTAWVFLAEGEKDVDNLCKSGYVATTNAGGAGKWMESYSKTLQGRRVCILPDNDDPGRNHALVVGKQLANYAIDIRVLELPDLPQKGDVSDWIAAGNNPTQLAVLVENAPTFAEWAEAKAEKLSESPQAAAQASEIKSKADTWLDALRALGHTFKLSVLEDMVEIDGKRLDDITRSKLYLNMVSRGVSKNYVDDCINVLASENAYHPIKEYLNSLQWDGQNHLGRMLGHIKGDGKKIAYAEGLRPLHHALIGRWLLGCVARALDGDREHAFKHQTPMLVFVGNQGIGKSSLVRWLVSGVGYEFHRESALDPHHPDHIRSAVTKWIWEVSELGASLRKGDRDALKGFITQEWHTYRKPWGKANITKPLLANFVGTVNPEIGFLDDPTGHRRFLPVHITDISREYQSAVDINQLWAQVVAMYRQGESPELSPVEQAALKTTYEEHEVEDPLQTYLRMYFDIEPANANKKTFTAEIINRLRDFGVSISNDPKWAGRRLNDALAPMGLKRELMSINGGKGWGWRGITPNGINPPPR